MNEPDAPAPPASELAAPYQPTPAEREALEAYIARKQQKPPSPPPDFQCRRGEPIELSVDHPDPEIGSRLLANALGTADLTFFNGPSRPDREGRIARPEAG